MHSLQFGAFRNEEIQTKMQVPESKQKKGLAFSIPLGVHCPSMAKTPKIEKPEKIQFRPTDIDFAIIQAGIKKHGADMSQVLRMALRRLAEADNLKVAV